MSEPLTLEGVYEKYKGMNQVLPEMKDTFIKLGLAGHYEYCCDSFYAIKAAAEDIERGVESIKQPEPSPATTAVSPLLLPHAHGV